MSSVFKGKQETRDLQNKIKSAVGIKKEKESIQDRSHRWQLANALGILQYRESEGKGFSSPTQGLTTFDTLRSYRLAFPDE